MDEISLTQKWINSLFLLGGGFLFFYTLIYCTLWLAMAILGGLVKQDDEDASILDRSARTSRASTDSSLYWLVAGTGVAEPHCFILCLVSTGVRTLPQIYGISIL